MKSVTTNVHCNIFRRLMSFFPKNLLFQFPHHLVSICKRTDSSKDHLHLFFASISDYIQNFLYAPFFDEWQDQSRKHIIGRIFRLLLQLGVDERSCDKFGKILKQYAPLPVSGTIYAPIKANDRSLFYDLTLFLKCTDN
ncbi:hypothetical protein AVEN_220067-1 [Araneus ventricosus]|uniref:Uncharacterized protein n=1 Tax=Araneus ventricosus TaxID=182803 RepID=A0A4Y2HLS9_ARAVE|nr:hypothetical protein AVEN_220067-1 [Araneus ventricosus]